LHSIGKIIDPSALTSIEENLAIELPEGETFDLLTPESESNFAEQLTGYRLLIIDTLRRVHCRNENDSAEMAAVISKMEWIAAQSGTSVIFLHHSNKSSALNGQVGEQQSSRGSSVLVDNVRWQGFLATMSKEEAKKNGISEIDRKYYVRFGVSKQNYGPPIEDIWLQRQPGGVLRKTEFEKCEKGTCGNRRVKNGN
jgi:RecA-family ATPase